MITQLTEEQINELNEEVKMERNIEYLEAQREEEFTRWLKDNETDLKEDYLDLMSDDFNAYLRIEFANHKRND
jgi:hypothetical protein